MVAAGTWRRIVDDSAKLNDMIPTKKFDRMKIDRIKVTMFDFDFVKNSALLRLVERVESLLRERRPKLPARRSKVGQFCPSWLFASLSSLLFAFCFVMYAGSRLTNSSAFDGDGCLVEDQ